MKKLIYILFLITSLSWSQTREEISLNANWKTTIVDSNANLDLDFSRSWPVDINWKTVDVPHNWDQYEGFRQMKHGNLHGTAWYSKQLKIGKQQKDKRYFLFFEGVNSYATVWVNGKEVGQHKGGRTTFTLDITDALQFNAENKILVKAAHPAFITDLPWVCGGCSGEWGFSEGSQPMGIFRPVTLVVTNEVRVAPFGVHIWNDKSTTKEEAILHTTTEIQNFSPTERTITVVNTLLDNKGKEVASVKNEILLLKGTKEIQQTLPVIKNPNLWSPENPYLYTLSTTILGKKDSILDKITTPYGIRWVSWPVGRVGDDKRFFINDKPVFINGTCEYEHQLGQSHAFSDIQIKARIEQIKAAGFNSFREAHQPHNLKYQQLLDESGILFWSQFSAHIWYDTPQFKENFKTLLREWIKERRNNPSVVLWGLQNESTIPKEFAEECTQIIREMDPTAAEQRKVTTCNGGEGTDWNVVQNWSGTYGGDPYNYDVEMTTQLLNGEYGAWRSIDLHTEGEFDQKGILSENRFSQLMEIKVREAESVKDKIAGQFNWLFASHENPGREQNGEGFRTMDQVGPVNYKGLFSIWGEPLDAYYMYRANYVSNKTNPMVYIVSHSWPNRWEKTGVKNGIDIYSNCDEVELFNDVNHESLGKLKNPGKGQHFQWNNVNIQYNVLYAVGYVDGKKVAQDYVVLNNLPEARYFKDLNKNNEEVVVAKPNYNYLYRVNCGGDDFVDTKGNLWMADVHKSVKNSWGSLSWTDHFKNLPAYFASQRTTSDLVDGTQNDALFQNFRYGMNQLRYEFPVADGEYEVELYFSEPWYGLGGGMDCKDWRVFDVAINDQVVLKDFDIWKEVGFAKAIKKTFKVKSQNGQLVIAFSKVSSGEAIISAIAIASKDKSLKAAEPSPKNIMDVKANASFEIGSWLNLNAKQYVNSEEVFTQLPAHLYTADYLRLSNENNITGSFISKEDATVSVLIDAKIQSTLAWLSNYKKSEATAKNSKGVVFSIFEKEVKKGEQVTFGNNENTSAMYSIVVVPSSDLGKVKDDRPTLKLEAELAKIKGEGVEKGNFKSSDYVEFTKASANSIEFEVNPGVANVYLMRFRYMNMTEAPIKVKLIIEDAYGILLRNDTIDFAVPTEKWKLLNTTSGGYINAGKYKIRLESDNMKGLRLDSFEFQ
ncbi:malectin domain-containing carbohydrate-binding protein [Flavobacterium sp. MAHUQ-51]|uniref:malectin domain-containing carbohydrate-binding protein n=1 Tax=Flavobacterium sp. GCM10022190 TaxID=3252639 RepID=UPI0036195C1A